MLYPPGFYFVKKPKRFVILSSDKSSERNLSSFFDIKKTRRIKHLQSEEPFSSDPYFSYTSKVSRTLLKSLKSLFAQPTTIHMYIVLEQKKTCLVFIGPQVATFIYQRDRILLPNHQLGGWFCPRVVISLGKILSSDTHRSSVYTIYLVSIRRPKIRKQQQKSFKLNKPLKLQRNIPWR
jgi:hypothetical protein